MFKFVESKIFFYVSAILSLIWVAAGCFYTKRNMIVYLNMIFVAILIIAMMIFYNYKNKELMKSLLTAFITVVFLVSLLESGDVINAFRIRLIEQTNTGFVEDRIRVMITSANLFIVPFLIFLLYINHFIINFNGEASKVIININKIIVIVLFLFIITDKISIYIINGLNNSQILTLPSNMSMMIILRNLHLVFYTLLIVSAEAFINTQRELKAKKR